MSNHHKHSIQSSLFITILASVAIAVTAGSAFAGKAGAGGTANPAFSGGGCVPLVTPHIEQKHVGKTDAELIARARAKQGPASTWKTDQDVLNAEKNLFNAQCPQMLQWLQGAPILGTRTFKKSSTGVGGRWCSATGVCRTALGMEMVMTKYFGWLGFNVSFITTAYPVP